MNLLPAQFVLEAQLIEAIALVGLALDGHAGFVLRQVIRRKLITA